MTHFMIQRYVFHNIVLCNRNCCHHFLRIKMQYITVANHYATDVKHIIHAIALHEHRGPYKETMMHIPVTDHRNLKQVWFLGAHGDLGWENPEGGIHDIPLAWMLQQLQDTCALQYDENKLAVRFPRMNKEATTIQESPEFVHDAIRRTGTGFSALIGWRTRKPISHYRDRMKTNEKVHPTVRLRGYGVNRHDAAIPGFHVEERHGRYVWVQGSGRTGSTGSNGSMEPATIEESELGELEARLLGIRVNQDDFEAETLYE
jgi:hypothetical protein